MAGTCWTLICGNVDNARMAQMDVLTVLTCRNKETEEGNVDMMIAGLRGRLNERGRMGEESDNLYRRSKTTGQGRSKTIL